MELDGIKIAIKHGTSLQQPSLWDLRKVGVEVIRCNIKHETFTEIQARVRNV